MVCQSWLWWIYSRIDLYINQLLPAAASFFPNEFSQSLKLLPKKKSHPQLSRHSPSSETAGASFSPAVPVASAPAAAAAAATPALPAAAAPPEGPGALGARPRHRARGKLLGRSQGSSTGTKTWEKLPKTWEKLCFLAAEMWIEPRNQIALVDIMGTSWHIHMRENRKPMVS